MSSMALSSIVFACVCASALLGMGLRRVLPEHHLSDDSKETVKLGVGLVSTMAALVLGLLVASAKSSFDTRSTELTQIAANIVLLDRVLAHYGPETSEIRIILRRSVALMINRIWPQGSTEATNLDPLTVSGETLYDKIQALSPRNDLQRSLKAKALSLGVNVAETRWLLFAQSGSAIPTPFLIVLAFWLCVIFVSIGLFAPQNSTVAVTLFLSALSVSTAIFLILELDRSFQGILQVSSAPLTNALARLGQ